MDLGFLRSVAKPTRYTGGEMNEVVKAESPGLLHVALAFPDTYDIGMSYLGLQILYRAINGRAELWAERAFMPMPDMEEALLSRGLPLYALESKRPLSAFDIVGFSLVFELTYVNVLRMLRLGGIPLRSAERSEAHPLILAGGPCAVNPEPLAEFVDAFFLGEGEDGILDICDLMRSRGGMPRAETLRELARIPGIYVPSLYATEPDPISGMTVISGPSGEGVPFPVRRRIVWDLDAHPFPSRTLVPLHEVIHDRFSVEIARGCASGCRFCQAGYTYRPYRERSPGSARSTVTDGLAATGFNEVTLLSLNAGEYRNISALALAIAEDGASQSVGVAMPSLRASSLTRDLAASLSSGRKSGFTIAPEAGTQRLRDVINKNITEEDILNATSVVFSSGWNLVKLYFMIGLPTECEEDVDAIARLGEAVARTARREGNRRAQVNLSTSSFVPKPFTPFQWRPMERPDSLLAKQRRLKQLLRRPVDYKWHDARMSMVEAVLSLGDRRVGRALERAADLGCGLDAWTEHFRFDLWERAFAEAGVDVEATIHRERTLGERLPWDHLDVGVRKDFLWREWERALRGEATLACGAGSCEGCAEFAPRCVAGEFERKDAETRGRGDAGRSGNPPCPPFSKGGASKEERENRREGESASTQTASGSDAIPASPLTPRHSPLATRPSPRIPHPSPLAPRPSPLTTHTSPLKYRLRYRKEGPAAFLGHLDLVDVLVRGLRRAGARLAYSQGFHPMPKVEPAAPLPLGVEGRAEMLDLALREPPAPDLCASLNRLLPRGLTIENIQPQRPGDLPLSNFTRQAYEIGLSPLHTEDRAAVAGRVRDFICAESWLVTRESKGGIKTLDLRARVHAADLDGDSLRIELSQGGFMDLLKILVPGPAREQVRLARISLAAPTECRPSPQRRGQDLHDAYEASETFRP